ncbi:hypothetical protein [Candidatus Deferrimicrobium sp.]|uniref:hypothetical protein n=1 Tax=Candidatus Deferrimicrobium sp. TaxID=3060586 RepID=UPI002728E1F3|nr:hypothetical protein [Candidatus Deferrimicrobium sp.]MDO8737526.1 hypothetical protein [Candidatus Deferrimicrobium sp.]
MKRQYLGDSKDSFKWDYHDYLTSALRFPRMNIILMLTPDDQGRHGETHPELFPAREVVISFCRILRKERNVQLLRELPTTTGASYLVDLHNPEIYFARQKRRQYFSGLPTEGKHLFFLDPDNGFEPEKSSNENHVLYSDIKAVLEQISEESVISVFQHFRRIPFEKDFARIKERLKERLASVHIAAVYWRHFLMFVTITKNRETIEKVIAANHQYSQRYPVIVLR